MVAFLYRMPSGIPGAYNRTESLTAEPGLLLAGSLPIGFGVPVAVDAATGRYRGLGAGDTPASVAGLLMRSYPSVSMGTAADGLGATPILSTVYWQSIMKRGYLTVLLNGTIAAAKAGAVFARIAGASAGKPVGGLEAAADGTNTIQLPAAYWMGPADAQGNCEIAFNI